MATVTYFTDRQSAHTPLEGHGSFRQRLDFSKNGGQASSDVVQLCHIPAGMIVTSVDIRLITVEGSTCTGTIGDAVDPNGYHTSMDLDGTADTLYVSNGAHTGNTDYVLANPNVGGVLYASADTIDITLSNASSTAVFDIIVGYRYTAQTDL